MLASFPFHEMQFLLVISCGTVYMHYEQVKLQLLKSYIFGSYTKILLLLLYYYNNFPQTSTTTSTINAVLYYYGIHYITPPIDP